MSHAHANKLQEPREHRQPSSRHQHQEFSRPRSAPPPPHPARLAPAPISSPTTRATCRRSHVRAPIRPLRRVQGARVPRGHPTTHLERPIRAVQHLRVPLLLVPVGRPVFHGTCGGPVGLSGTHRTHSDVPCRPSTSNDALVGVVVSKLEPHRGGPLRGYVAMLAVREEHRCRGIGASPLVPPPPPPLPIPGHLCPCIVLTRTATRLVRDGHRRHDRPRRRRDRPRDRSLQHARRAPLRAPRIPALQAPAPLLPQRQHGLPAGAVPARGRGRSTSQQYDAPDG